MKSIYILLILSLFSFMVQAQTITITDSETKQPLEAVSIYSQQLNLFTTTNAKGKANISNFKGATEIQLRILGYQMLFLSFDSIAQTQFNVSLKPIGITLDQLVISATRFSQNSRSVPTKITTLSPKEVAFQNPQTAADMLAITGDVFIQKSQQGGGSPMIRGFSTNRLLYTVDGVRMNTAIFRSGNLQNVISLDAFATEKTEVLFGPGAIIYGSDAIGGVMSFQTLTPKLSATDSLLVNGSATARYATANQENTGHFHVNLGLKKWAFVTSFTYTKFGDLTMGKYGPNEYLKPLYVVRENQTDVVKVNPNARVQNPSGYNQLNIMQKVLFKPTAHKTLEYGFHYSETSAYSRYDRHLRYRNGLPRYGEWSYGPQIWMMNNFLFTNTNKRKFFDEYAIRVAHQHFEESRYDRDLNKSDRSIRIEKVEAFSLNIDAQKQINQKNKLVYGVEGILNLVNSVGKQENVLTGIVTSGPARYPQATWSSFAAFASNQYKVSDKLNLQAGIRYSHFLIDATFDTTFFPFPFTQANLNSGALNGSFGLVYQPTQKWILSTNLATGFRAPNVDDFGKIFDFEQGAVVVPNPNLSAEYAYNIDVDVAKVFGNFLKIDVTGYFTYLNNALVRRNFTLNDQDSIIYDGVLSQVQAIQNAANAIVYGLQGGFEAKLFKGFELRSKINFQVGQEELDNGTTSPSRHAPPWFGVTRITYQHKNTQIQFYSFYSGERKFEDLPFEEQGKNEIYAIDKNGNPWSPGWYTLNVKASTQVFKFMTFSAGVENITNQRYRPYSSGIVAAGRNLVVSLRVNF